MKISKIIQGLCSYVGRYILRSLMTMLKLLACVWLLGAMPCANAGDLIKVEASPEAPMDVSECCANNGASGCKTTVACAPGHQMCPPGRFGDHGPQFHVRDASCTINDPNGPIYDPVHGVYHLHYQNHVGLHGGRTWGHAVSKDLAHWAHLPISIWNDQPYDSNTIASGSGTVVNGKIIQVYPGICNKTQQGCPNSANLCIAVRPCRPIADELVENMGAEPPPGPGRWMGPVERLADQLRGVASHYARGMRRQHGLQDLVPHREDAGLSPR